MIESKVVLVVLLIVMLIGFAVSAIGRMDLGGFIILIGVIGYFIFNKREK